MRGAIYLERKTSNLMTFICSSGHRGLVLRDVHIIIRKLERQVATNLYCENEISKKIPSLTKSHQR
jgi:hypothetical protein